MRAEVKRLGLYITFAVNIVCAAANAEDLVSVEYYRSFAGYQHPVQLIGKETKEEAESADAAYYMGYFDSKRKLVKVVKIMDGKMIFEYTYSYHSNGKLRRVESLNDASGRNIQEFNESGKLIAP